MELNWKSKSAMFVLVTPQVALAWLEKHNNKNRDKRVSVIAKYARDMEQGRWADNGESVQFDWNGELMNGQHRLEAIWRTQSSIEMLVVTGLNPDSRPTIDNQSKRRFVDVIKGSDMLGAGQVPANTAAGMWPAMRQGMLQTKGVLTHAELLVFAEAYRDGGVFALNEFGKHKRTRVVLAPVIAAVARAYYHIKLTAVLERFVEVLCTGIQRSPDDKTIIYLREWLNDEGKQKNRNSNSAHEVYGKTARTIEAYADGQSLSKLYMPREDPFPLPDRSAAAAPLSARAVVVDAGQLATRGQGRIALAEAVHG